VSIQRAIGTMLGKNDTIQGFKTNRLMSVDAVRGAAIGGVVVFHLVWDLEFAGFISGVAFHPVWLLFGRVLAGTFMFLVGFSLVLAHGSNFRFAAFARRLGIITVAAIAVTIATFLAFPDSFVFFGILHSIAVATLIGTAFLYLPVSASLLAGATIMALPWFVASSSFDTRWMAWIGFFANAPASNDLVPVFPWAGLTLLGVASGRFHYSSRIRTASEIPRVRNLFSQWLAWMGRHSLPIYLAHQPALLAVIVPLSRWL
jgi:uncharacterized membrane protein